MKFNLQHSYEAIFNSAVDGIVVTDENNIIRSFSPGAEKLLGWKQEEIIGKDVALIIPERYREAHYAGVQRFLNTRIPKVIGQPFVRLSSLHKDGSEIPTNFSIATYDEDGQIFFTAILRDIRQIEEHEERQNILIKELNHRVKNMLAVVNGIVSQTAKHSSTIEQFQGTLQDRIMTMSKVHDLLVESNWSHTTLEDLVTTFLKPYGHNYVYKGPFVELRPSVAVTMGMAIHELATNCIKYGAWSNKEGKVTLYGITGRKRVCLSWKEQGGPVVKEPEHHGFGLVLLDRVVSGSLRGKSTITFEPDGFRYELVAPLSKDIKAISGE